jgi:hypothetical protein
LKKVWKLKNPVYVSQTGKKAATETDGPTASNSVRHTLTQPDRRSGGKKAEFLGTGGYTKNGNRKFYKKKLKAP